MQHGEIRAGEPLKPECLLNAYMLTHILMLSDNNVKVEWPQAI